MSIKIRQAHFQDWETIQKLNSEVFQNDKKNGFVEIGVELERVL